MANDKIKTAQAEGSKKMTPILIGSGVALAGFLMIQSQIKSSDAMARKKYARPMVAALQAVRRIEAKSAIDVGALGFRLVAKDDQPWSTYCFEDPGSGSVASNAYENLILSLSGRMVNRTVEKGDLVLQTDIETEGVHALGDVLKPGQRAVAVQVERHSLFGGLLQPNERVDVLATYEVGIGIIGGSQRSSQNKDLETRVILQDVPIAAIGSRMARSENARGSAGDTTVVLALTPDQAMLFSHIQKEAKISLLLKPHDDMATKTPYSKESIRSGNDVTDLIDKVRK